MPVLGNLPLVGVLFRGKTDTVTREEVIIILTPHIIDESCGNPSRASVRMTFVLKREAVKDSLQIIDRAKMAEDAYARAAKYYLEGDIEKALFNLKTRVDRCVRRTWKPCVCGSGSSPRPIRRNSKRIDSIATEKVGEQEEEGMWLRQLTRVERM